MRKERFFHKWRKDRASPRKMVAALLAGAMIVSGTAVAFRQKAWAAETGKSAVSALKIQEITDGVGPFDADDKPGNDSGQSNGIVRSFDKVGYTLAYTTMLKTADPITEGKLMVEFTLPSGKATAQWDTSQMAWMENPKVTVNADGSQTITGSKTLRNTAGHNAIPGAGTLSAGIEVKGASNGAKIAPTFKVWMEGNADGEKKSVTAKAVTVSAAPKVDVQISYTGGAGNNDIRGYYDFSSGKYSSTKKDGYKPGRLQGYGIALSLYNDSSSKGLKGIEIPSGDISFDMTLSEAVSKQGTVTPLSGDDYKPLLWDYKANREGKAGDTGVLGRQTYIDGYDYASLNAYLPRSTDQDSPMKRDQVFNGGRMTVTGTADKLHVKVSGYKFDTDKWYFPQHYIQPDSIPTAYSANVGYFSVGFILALLRHPETVTDQKDVYMSAELSNFSISTASGQKGNDMVASDNRDARSISLYPPGRMQHDTIFAGSSQWAGPDATTYPGTNVYMNTSGRFSFDGRHAKAANNLLKFDSDGLEPAETAYRYLDFSNSTSRLGKIRILYAAKKDGTGWKDQNERNSLHEKDLIFYDSLKSLKAAGKVPVGLLAEIRDSDLVTGAHSDVWSVNWLLVMKKDAIPGHTYGAVSDIDIWMDGTDFERLGHDGEALPEAGEHHSQQSSYYRKAEFDSSGNIMAGTHTGGYQEGNTIKAISMWAMISKKTADKDSSGKAKTSYDVDSNERKASFSLHLTTEGNKGGSDTFTVTDTLPKDLHYVSGSAVWGSTRLDPEVTVNSDGTTTLKWKGVKLEAGKTYEDIAYTASIGTPGSADDVKNNQQITNTATIISEAAPVAPVEKWGTKTSSTITIIKLTSVSVRKSTDTPKVDIGQRFSYTFDFANGTQSTLSNVRLFDVLPYNGDGRNTSFSGTYSVESVTADFSKASGALASSPVLQASSSSDARKNEYSYLSSYKGWTETAGTKSGTSITWKPASDTKAIGLKFNAGGLESVKVTVNLVPGSGQKEGDAYINDILENADGQVQYVRSNRAVVQIRGNIKLQKKWSDWDDALKKRPSSVTVTVLQNGVKYRDITLTSSGGWKAKISDVPVYDEDGNRYRYTATDNVGSYSAVQTASASDPLDLTLTNSYRTHDVTVSKASSGNFASRSRRFVFSISLKGLVPNRTYSVTSPVGNSTVTADSSGSAKATVRIGSGEKAVVKDVPEQATFQASEDEKTDYEPSFTINGGAMTRGRTTPVTSVTQAMSVSYNNRLVAFLPTGIARSMGMSAMLAVAIAATGTAVVLVIRRRKKKM